MRTIVHDLASIAQSLDEHTLWDPVRSLGSIWVNPYNKIQVPVEVQIRWQLRQHLNGRLLDERNKL